MDQFDRAQELEMAEREQCIRIQRAASRKTIKLTNCTECGEYIPKARRDALSSVTLCVDCQEILEQQQKRGMR